jgi:TRAP transporter TAXI family solute receptor
MIDRFGETIGKRKEEDSMKKIFSRGWIFVMVILLSPYGIHAQTSPSKNEIINLSLGSVSSTSGVYAFAVSLAGVVRKNDPGIMVTAVEGGGGFDHAKLMKQGVLDWSISGSPAVAVAVRGGIDNFKKEGPWEPVRLMFMRNMNVARIYVRADTAKNEGIRTWSDLAGKKFCPGIPGTRDMTRAMDANKILGTGIKMVPSSMADAINNLKEGSIVGILKGSPQDRFDAGMIECHYSTALTVIGFKKEEAEKLQANNPLDTFYEIPVGSIRELPGVGGFWEMNSVVMVMSSSRMSQEVGYRLVKAVYKGWDEIATAYPPSKGIDPVADAFKNTPAGEHILFHAGVIQFAKERGMKVPEDVIPPEYKGPK